MPGLLLYGKEQNMTVQKDVTKNIYVGNGSTRTFPFTFECPAEHPEYVNVYLVKDDGSTTATEDYFLDMKNKTITYPSSGAPLESGRKIIIKRELPLQQLMNLINNGPYFAEDIETAFDECIMIAQQQKEQIDRTLVLPAELSKENFNNEIPYQAGKSFRISDDGSKIETTEDPAKVVPQVNSLLEQGTNAVNNLLEQTKVTAANAEDSAQNAADSANTSAETLNKVNEVAANAAASAASAAASAADARVAKDLLRAPNSNYNVGDVVAASGSMKYQLECVTAGTSADGTLNIVDSNLGDTLTDGTVVWRVIKKAAGVQSVTEDNGVVTVTDAGGGVSNFEAGGIPIGFEYFTTNPNLQAGWLPLLGGVYSRTTYADLWAWVQEQDGYLLTEEDWQAKATANNGNVPFYSSGDGSTTFRVPALKCWVRGADSISEVGGYLAAGLPNIEGTTPSGDFGPTSGVYSGAFKYGGEIKGGAAAGGTYDQYAIFDASLSNPIYGASDTVQPESIVGLWCVKAYGTVTNTGSVTTDEIASSIRELDNKVNESLLLQTNGTYYSPKLFTPNKTNITVPKMLTVVIGDKTYTNTTDKTLQTSSVDTLTNLAGKDVYIYACVPNSGTEPVFVLSLNSTVPTGYTADNSRKIGGFHCLCLNVGALTNVEPVTGATVDHGLKNYNTGEIIPASVWDLWHRPAGEQTEGMTYIEPVDVWMGLYGASWDGSKLVHVNNGVWADGSSTKKWHGELSQDALVEQGMRLPWRHEFRVAAMGSNEGTNIKGSADPNTTGGHVDTAGRRMVSNYGLEDACGALWQWLMDLGFAGGSGWTDSVYNSSVDPQRYGQTYGGLYRLLAGGSWSYGSGCGSRSSSCADGSAAVNASGGCRGASEPLHRKTETRKAV